MKGKKILHTHGCYGLTIKPFEIKESITKTLGNTFNYIYWNFYYYPNFMSKYINNFDALISLHKNDSGLKYFNKAFKGKKFILGNAADNLFFKEEYEKIDEFNEIINSFVNFLLKNNGDGTIIVESRNLTQNRSTQKLYTTMTQTGTNIYLPTTIKRKISTLNFNIKKDNCIGLQIADMIPLVLVRRIHGKSNPYTLYNIFSSKLYKNNQSSVDGYGFIKVLR